MNAIDAVKHAVAIIESAVYDLRRGIGVWCFSKAVLFRFWIDFEPDPLSFDNKLDIVNSKSGGIVTVCRSLPYVSLMVIISKVIYELRQRHPGKKVGNHMIITY